MSPEHVGTPASEPVPGSAGGWSRAANIVWGVGLGATGASALAGNFNWVFWLGIILLLGGFIWVLVLAQRRLQRR